MKFVSLLLGIALIISLITCRNPKDSEEDLSGHKSKKLKSQAEKASLADLNKQLDKLPLRGIPFGISSMNIADLPADSLVIKLDPTQQPYEFAVQGDEMWTAQNTFQGNKRALTVQLSKLNNVEYLRYDKLDSVTESNGNFLDSIYLYRLPNIGPYDCYFKEKVKPKSTDSKYKIEESQDIVLIQKSLNKVIILNLLTEYSFNGDEYSKWFFIDKNKVIHIFHGRTYDFDDTGGTYMSGSGEVKVEKDGTINYKRLKIGMLGIAARVR